jgi:hypothetical protein
MARRWRRSGWRWSATPIEETLALDEGLQGAVGAEYGPASLEEIEEYFGFWRKWG